MPLFTVTMRSVWSADETDKLSGAIHAASVSVGYPENDLFQRFLRLDPADFRVDPIYPDLKRPRSARVLLIEVLVSSGTELDRKTRLVAALAEHLGSAGVDREDVLIFFLETDRTSGSFGGGRVASPVEMS